MTKKEFLNLLWPSQGWRVLAVNGDPFVDPQTGAERVPMRHRVYDANEEARLLLDIDALADKRNVWFAMATFKEREIQNPSNPEKKGTRLKANAGWVKTLWADVDVGKEDGYATKEEALAATKVFVQSVGMPKPVIVDSGGGLHFYWPFTAEVDAETWLPIAEHFKQLCLRAGWKIDAMCSTDVVRVLRVPETFNRKRDTPRPVTLIHMGGAHDSDQLHEKIKLALTKLGVQPTNPFDLLGDNTDKTYDGPSEPFHVPTLARKCNQVKVLLEARGNVQEPFWYAGLQLMQFAKGPEKACLAISDGYPNFSRAEMDTKLKQASTFGPTLCTKLEAANPGGCDGCPFKGHIKSPISIGRKLLEAPPPQLTIPDPELGTDKVVELPPPPWPYARRENGGIIKRAGKDEVDEDGKPVGDKILYEFEIYPVRRVHNEITRSEAVVWRANLPFAGWVEFEIDSKTHYDVKELMACLAARGVYPSIPARQEFQKFMVAYIQQLQRQADTDKVYAKLGWRDDGSFVFNGKQYMPTRTVVANINPDTTTGVSGLGTKGTLAGWQIAAAFYNNPRYDPQAFCFFTGFGSVLFKFTGYEGAIVNMVGSTGAGKSTVLQAVTSVWGNPKELMLSGTKQAATVLARIAQISLLNNLPVAVDEITSLEPQALSDMCYQVSQGKGRERLGRNGKLQSDHERWCTMMACSSNTSIYSKLASLKYDSSAEAMRTFEYSVSDPKVHTMAEADDILIPAMMENYGVAGDAFIEYVVRNKQAVRDLLKDLTRRTVKACDAKAPERFWIAIIAANITAALVAIKAGVLPWAVEDVRRVHKWACNQLLGSRSVVKSNVVDPSSVLAEFLNDKLPNTIYITADTNNLKMSNVVHPPRGPLVVHIELDTRKILINRGEFRKFCNMRGADFNEVKKALRNNGTLINPDKKATLGRGTEYAAGQIDCWWLDMNSPDLSDMETP